MKSFFITGLPRSRTAWWAVFLSHDRSFCYHEALLISTPYQWKIMFQSLMYPFVGNSDSGLAFFADEVRECFPDSPIVIIERSPEESFLGIQKLFPDSKNNRIVIEKTLAKLEVMKKMPNVHVFQFNDLDQMEVCREIQQICKPFEPFYVDRWKMLNRLTVEIRKAKYPTQFPGHLMDRVQEMLK